MITRRHAIFLTITMAMISTAMTACEGQDTTTQPAIVLVAFGTSVPEARRTFDYIDAAARVRYPDHDIRWAFTSEFIRKKLAKQGIHTMSLDDVIATLRTEGIDSAVFQSLHIAPGQEYREISAVDTTGMTIAVGDALLTSDQDIADTISAIEPHINSEAEVVVVAHGNEHHPELNAQILGFAAAIEAEYTNVSVCSVEGQPGSDRLAQVRLRTAEGRPVIFIPLMIVAGDHIINDVMGNEPDSWRVRVNAPDAACTPSLGYNDAILDIYFRHIDHAMDQLTD